MPFGFSTLTKEKAVPTYKKLVRDKIPRKIRRSGQKPQVRVLTPIEFKAAILDKILEEAQEVHDAQTYRELKAELADLYEAARELMRFMRMPRKDLRREVKKRRKKRGGFKEGFFLEGVTPKAKKPKK